MSDLERTSRLENQVIEALAALIRDFDYGEDDFVRLIETAQENA